MLAGLTVRQPGLVIVTVRDRYFTGPIRLSTAVAQIQAERAMEMLEGEPPADGGPPAEGNGFRNPT